MGQHVTLRIQVSAASLFPFRPNPIRISEKKKCDSHCWHSHCCRTFFAPMSHRTAGIRTFDIRTLVSFALLTPSHCWHSHCWLRTGVVRTSVFRTLVVQAPNVYGVSNFPSSPTPTHRERLALRPAGSDPEVVCQKNSFLKVSVSLGGFGPSVAHGKHSVRRRCVQATKNKAETCSLLDAIGRRSCGR